MGRIVYQKFNVVLASDVTQDIWSVVAGSGSPILLHGFEITSAAIAAAIINVDLHRITAAGTGGVAPGTEELADERFSAVTATFRTEDTTPGAGGGGLMDWQWEQLGPVGHVYTPETRPRANAGDGFAFGMFTAATPTLSGWVCWEEFG
jgi:hypothetical protein